jgi:hypothetical protein
MKTTTLKLKTGMRVINPSIAEEEAIRLMAEKHGIIVNIDDSNKETYPNIICVNGNKLIRNKTQSKGYHYYDVPFSEFIESIYNFDKSIEIPVDKNKNIVLTDKEIRFGEETLSIQEFKKISKIVDSYFTRRQRKSKKESEAIV